MKKLTRYTAVLISLMMLLLTACGNGKPDVPPPETQTYEHWNRESDTETETEAETEKETERETESSRVEPGYRDDDPSEEEILKWADDLYNDAIQDLADRGVIPAPAEEYGELKLEFETDINGRYTLRFLDREAGRQLLAKTDIVPEMVIVSAPGSAYRTAGRQRLDQAVPYFFPGTTMAG
ncbi:MAG: hypothetical protein IJM62_03770, partial [Lachnospiraceae bacterium]|nr:hypothetical protein [Lachnospiraceae bacterium]